MAAKGLVAHKEDRDKLSECVGRGLLQALGVGSISFSTLYFSQKYFFRNVKGVSRSTIIISSTIFTGMAAYMTGAAALERCNKNFNKAVEKSNH